MPTPAFSTAPLKVSGVAEEDLVNRVKLPDPHRAGLTQGRQDDVMIMIRDPSVIILHSKWFCLSAGSAFASSVVG